MKRLLILILSVLLCFLCSCNTNGTANKGSQYPEESDQVHEAVYGKISAEQAKNIMDEGKPFILLDVRTDEEFKEIRIEGAVLIPDYEIAGRAEAELPDKNALILIYCRSGRRSANAAYELNEKGYTNVYDFGGIIDWPYDTVSG